MDNTVYNPFTNLDFRGSRCFLTGTEVLPGEEINVFPAWIMEQFALTDRPFKLLDESMATYGALKVPCSAEARSAIETLDEEISQAFTSGYEAVSGLLSLKLFQWMGKLVYGIIYNELRIGMRQQQASGEPFQLSEGLKYKFGNLQLMLQSLTRPMEFEERSPWTIKTFRVENTPGVFNYRDEINTLTFSLAMNDFGIIACLQDNGTNAIYNQEILDKITGKELKAIQYEELIARFYYSNYLFNRLPEYTVLPTPGMVYIEAMPLRGMSSKPLFDHWQAKPYGQVLENFWKPWGFSLFEIIKDPENPMSFLLDAEGNFNPDGDSKIKES
ncbi:hypothetical protein GZH53_13385 [Flavihumibacter sp. R14]|nr:hypothetical protein [Flavihumibacter soli]